MAEQHDPSHCSHSLAAVVERVRLVMASRRGRCQEPASGRDACGLPAMTADGFVCEACHARKVEAQRRSRENEVRMALHVRRNGICVHDSSLHQPGRSVTSSDFPRDRWSEGALHFVTRWTPLDGGLWIFGGVGSGKTTITGGLVERLLSEGVRVCAASALTLVRTLVRLRFTGGLGRDDEYPEALQHVTSAPVLFLDDVLSSSLNRQELDELFTILDGRWTRALPIVATSNLSRSLGLKEHLPSLTQADATARDRVASRLQALTGHEVPCLYPGDRRLGTYDPVEATALSSTVRRWNEDLGLAWGPEK